jgi:hypothetical protein
MTAGPNQDKCLDEGRAPVARKSRAIFRRLLYREGMFFRSAPRFSSVSFGAASLALGLVAVSLGVACGGDESAPATTESEAGGSPATGRGGSNASGGSDTGGSAGHSPAGAGGVATGGAAGAGTDGGAAGSGDTAGAGGTTAGAGNGGDTAAGGGGSAAGASGGAGGPTGGAAGTAGNTGGGAGTAAAGGGSGMAGSGGSAGSAPADACATKTPVCNATTGFKEGGGLVAIDRCAFPIKEAGFASYGSLIKGTEAAKLVKTVKIADVLGDLNRSAVQVTAAKVPGKPAGVKQAFTWATGDVNVDYWIPQGLSGSADAVASGLVDGKSVIVVAWYYDLAKDPGSTQKKGVRVAFVDVTNPSKPMYRFALLVEPTGTVDAPNFGPVNIHAGGIVWFGNSLYVADTSHGFRVFDLNHIWSVPPDDGLGCDFSRCVAENYAYVIPQSGKYEAGDTCDLLFSYVSLDRSVSPPTLISGEYCSDTACKGPLTGRAIRWPLDEKTGKLAAGTSYPAEAYVFQQKQVQGAAAHAGTFYLSSSAPAGGDGALYRVIKGKSKTSGWLDSPEDLLVDQPNKLLWSLSEADGARFVMGAALSSYPAP